MRKILVAVAFLVMVSLSHFAQAEQTVKTIELPVAYVPAATANTWYSKNMSFDPPDGISEMLSGEILIKGDWALTTIVSLTLNGQTCKQASWTTAGVATWDYNIVFDCDNLINVTNQKLMSFNMSLRANKNAANVYVRARYTYKNNPSPDNIFMHGTEYESGEAAKAWLQLVYSNGTAIDSAVCYLDIRYPDSTTYFVNDAAMTFRSDGLYEYNFEAPSTKGVYPMLAKCYYSATQNKTYATAYRLGVNGTYLSGALSDTYTDDNVYFNLKEATTGTPRNLEAYFNITKMCQPSPVLMTGLTVYWQGKWNSAANDDITIQIYNYTAADWMTFPNKILDATAETETSNSVSLTNLTKSGLTEKDGGTIRIHLLDSTVADTTASTFYTDLMWASCDQLGSPQWQEVRGSSEAHITTASLLAADVEYIMDVFSMYDQNGENNDSLVEGFAFENITVTSTSSLDDQTIDFSFQTPYKYDCSAFLALMEYNATSYTWFDATDKVIKKEHGDADESCKITVEDEIDKNEVKLFRATLDSYQWWEIEWAWDTVKTINDTAVPLCYARYPTYNFCEPLSLACTNTANDTLNRACHSIIDDIYWFKYQRDLAADDWSNNIITNFDGYATEVAFYRDEIYLRSLAISAVENFNDVMTNQALLYANIGLVTANNASLHNIITNASAYNQSVSQLIYSLNISGGSGGLTAAQDAMLTQISQDLNTTKIYALQIGADVNISKAMLQQLGLDTNVTKIYVVQNSVDINETKILSQEINQTTHSIFTLEQAINVTVSSIESIVSLIQGVVNAIQLSIAQLLGVTQQSSLDINATKTLTVEINATNRGCSACDLSSVLGNLTQISNELSSVKVIVTQASLDTNITMAWAGQLGIDLNQTKIYALQAAQAGSDINRTMAYVVQVSSDVNLTKALAQEINATNRGFTPVDLSSVLGNLTQNSMDINQTRVFVTQNGLDVNQTMLLAIEINATNRGFTPTDLSSVLGNLTQLGLDVNSTKVLGVEINQTAHSISFLVQDVNQTMSVNLAELRAVNLTLYNLVAGGSNLTAAQVWQYCLASGSGCYIHGTMG